MEITPEEIFAAGHAITDVERRFICREGVGRKDDYPPMRYFEPLMWQDGLDDESRTMKLDRVLYDGYAGRVLRLPRLGRENGKTLLTTDYAGWAGFKT